MIAFRPFPLSPRPVLPFSADAYFRDFVSSGKSRVKYLNIHPPQRIQIDTISHKQTLSNAKKASFAPLSTNKSTCYWLRTDVSAPSWSFVRTKTPTCPHFLAPEEARFLMCEIASFRQKRPTGGNKQTEKRNRRKGNRRKPRQYVFRESPEKGLPGHQSVFWRNEGHSQAVRLTICHIVKMPIPVHFPVIGPSTC